MTSLLSQVLEAHVNVKGVVFLASDESAYVTGTELWGDVWHTKDFADCLDITVPTARAVRIGRPPSAPASRQIVVRRTVSRRAGLLL